MSKIQHQNYNTYEFEEGSRDIVLKEYESAEKIATTQQRLVQNLITVLAVLSPFTIALISNENLILISWRILFFANIMFLFFTLVLLFIFAELQKEIIFNVRKVIVLRKWLGIDYGYQSLVLPVWRVEGATEPTAIRLAPNKLHMVYVPLIVLMSLYIGITTFFLLQLQMFKEYILIIITITLLVSLFYRWRLLDTYEDVRYFVFYSLTKLFRPRVETNIQRVIYSTKCAFEEVVRLEVETKNIKKVLIILEDGNFESHSGVSYLALMRAILSQSKRIRNRLFIIKSGGSTLHMQLARTLFIDQKHYNNFLRRKFHEVWLAFWLNRQFTKVEILNFYLVSVRFKKGVFGILDAQKDFLGGVKQNMSIAECIFLIERISAVSSNYRQSRIDSMFTKVVSNYDLSRSEIKVQKHEFNKLYSTLKEY